MYTVLTEAQFNFVKEALLETLSLLNTKAVTSYLTKSESENRHQIAIALNLLSEEDGLFVGNLQKVEEMKEALHELGKAGHFVGDAEEDTREYRSLGDFLFTLLSNWEELGSAGDVVGERRDGEWGNVSIFGETDTDTIILEVEEDDEE